MNPSRAVAEGCTLGAVPIPDVLRALLVEPGPSGHEEPALAGLARGGGGLRGGRVGHAGDVLRARPRRQGAPTLAVVGHIDEIGVAVTHIDESGLLSFTTVGGITPEVLVGQRVRIAGRGGDVRGGIARKRLAPEAVRDRPRLEHADLHIDIGARDRADAERLVRPGDAGVWDGEPVELPNGRDRSKALDNRLGAYVALESARRLAEKRSAQVDVVAVAVVQEEIGDSTAPARQRSPWSRRLRSRSTSRSRPTCRGGNPRRTGATVDLGAGGADRARADAQPTRRRSPRPCSRGGGNPARVRGVHAATRIPTRTRSTSRASASPTGLISIPTRYMHSPCESARSTISRPWCGSWSHSRSG